MKLTWRGMAAIVLALSVGYYLGKYLGQPSIVEQALFQALLFIAGFSSTVVVGVKDYVLEKVREREVARQEHREHILQVLRQDAASKGRVDYVEDRINLTRFKWGEDHELYDKCLSHLSSYNGMTDSLVKAKSYSDGLVNRLNEEFVQFQGIVEDRLRSFTVLPPKDNFVQGEPHYVKPILKYAVYTDVSDMQEKNVHSMTFSIKESTLTWGAYSVGYGNADMLSGLLTAIRTIEDDDAVKNKISTIRGLRSSLEKNEELNNFEAKRKTLVKELSYTWRRLRGKCDFCPT